MENCIENQYSNYGILSQNVSGTLTLGENIADNGGLKTAYYAYKSWLAKQKIPNTELPLPGLNHTHEQLFFLSFEVKSYLFQPNWRFVFCGECSNCAVCFLQMKTAHLCKDSVQLFSLVMAFSDYCSKLFTLKIYYFRL